LFRQSGFRSGRPGLTEFRRFTDRGYSIGLLRKKLQLPCFAALDLSLAVDDDPTGPRDHLTAADRFASTPCFMISWETFFFFPGGRGTAETCPMTHLTVPGQAMMSVLIFVLF
jgi:hypothetical protein